MAMPILNQETIGQTIDYTYDPLGRLTAADYSTGDYYHYTYDEVGNRLSQDSSLNNQQTTTNYTYDNANRMIQAGNATYTWDNNGNLLNDGAKTYTYDPANRLAGVVQGSNTYTYAYNGLGDRLQQIANGQTTNYTLDINSGLTQVLDDGTNTYTYGVDRISQQHGSTAEYYLDDALGSVRQLTDASDAVTLSESYDPYGNVISSAGSSTSIFGYTGEVADSYIKLINLRSRLYSPDTGRFTTRDTWEGNSNQPMSFDLWNYGQSNSVNYTDPTGHYNRNDAVAEAMQWDETGYKTLDPDFDFVSKIDRRESGNAELQDKLYEDQCSLFASSVLYKGGIRDTRGDPHQNGEKKDYSPIPYWDISILMTGKWNNNGYDGRSWYGTPEFHKFITSFGHGNTVLNYNYPPQRYKYV